jgi:leader peptidase (prepilin peptidase)/N-methyltransferase
VIDVDVHRLPNPIVLPSYLVAGVLLVPAVVAGGDWGAVGRALAAMAAVWAFYLVLALIYPGGMGLGDVKLAGLLGLYLGWLGWGSVLVGVFSAFLAGGLAGGLLLLTGRAGRKSAMPFGPFMLGGAFLALFAATPIVGWYGSLATPGA